MVYSLGRGGIGAPAGGGRPALTAAAIACLFSAGEYKDENVKKWFKFCQTRRFPSTAPGGARIGHDEYTHYYYRPGPVHPRRRRLGAKCSPARQKSAGHHLEQIPRNRSSTASSAPKSADGSWTRRRLSVGPVYSTAVYLHDPATGQQLLARVTRDNWPHSAAPRSMNQCGLTKLMQPGYWPVRMSESPALSMHVCRPVRFPVDFEPLPPN